jgi:hypothetical protein
VHVDDDVALPRACQLAIDSRGEGRGRRVRIGGEQRRVREGRGGSGEDADLFHRAHAQPIRRFAWRLQRQPRRGVPIELALTMQDARAAEPHQVAAAAGIVALQITLGRGVAVRGEEDLGLESTRLRRHVSEGVEAAAFEHRWRRHELGAVQRGRGAASQQQHADQRDRGPLCSLSDGSVRHQNTTSARGLP